MGVTSVAARAVDFADIQGLLRFGFGKLPETQYRLVRIRDAAAARTWCKAAPITSAQAQSPPPEIALQVAFSAAGLRALEVPDHIVDRFAPEFLSGMTGNANRSRRLGDTGLNDPSHWLWGSGPQIHALVMIFARHGAMEKSAAQVCTGPWDEAFEEVMRLSTSDLDGHEPFGFADGISQPELDWERGNIPEDTIEYTNRSALGEFLLGYPNEYGKYTDRPVLEIEEDGASELSPAEDYPGKRDLGRNGTYLVMRHLEQDVREFWRFAHQTAGKDGALKFAEAMVGRTLNGDPLVPKSSQPIDGIEHDDALNNFTYDEDPDAMQCPFAAHVRRTNPRNADLIGSPTGLISRVWTMIGGARKKLRDDLIASTRFHRILRRGREYGPGLSPEDALRPAPPNEPPRGLHFLCLNANISRQFEFVQGAWIASGRFNGLAGEPDPLLTPTGNFSMPRENGCPSLITGIPSFISVRGGEYFFLPSLRAIRYFSSVVAIRKG